MEFDILIKWYVAFFLLGIIGLPLSSYFFKDWKDKGYGFAKFFGLMLVGIPLWFLSSFKIVQFNEISVSVFFIGALIISLILIRRKNFKFNRTIILEEIIFAALMLIWAYIRGINPRIEGTEKLMNLAFMNSILRTEYFPPVDMWKSGDTINYYYIGHYLYAYICKLIGIGANFGYNLGVITVISQSFISLFSIFISLFTKVSRKKAIIIAFLGACMICFGGNFDYVIKLIGSFISGQPLNYFFTSASRLIPFVIDEFPSYSIVLADLHGHYIALPFFIMLVALSFVSFKIAIDTNKKLFFNMLVSPFIILMYGINSWDLLTVVFIFTVLHLYQSLKVKGKILYKFYNFMLAQVALIVPGVFFAIPYIISFKAPVGGIGFVPLETKSDFILWLIMWGVFLSIFALFAFAYLKKFIKIKLSDITWPALLTFCGLCLIVGVEFIFIKDIFFASNYSYFRTNTVFKFYYHAWTLWGITSVIFAYTIYANFLPKLKHLKILFIGLLLLIWTGSIIYVFKSIQDFYPITENTKYSLNGMNYIQKEYPGDYLAIEYINQNIKGQPVILEAVGDAYTYYSRVSANTGLPTIMGWPTHEWQWHNDSTMPFARSNDAQTLYTTTDQNVFKNLIEQYKVEYIYVGVKEREKYLNLSTELIEKNSTKIYDELGTQIYKINF